ncbi:acyl transferase domain-containing protein/acyl-CoA synthetase (AMP-forming)/AMP-acid ligase II/acyl carrier protein [Kibdelosporangium banguiense]|uniref:Acyl transferase domain-containing protein/acyl-CoA synthetase (AMP-forming)/AMP-acid ligase II/acyl carrier protein n=1 Tax=Kibdelosporangium banguiense TaxID=1365924 RepID=A0ABS4TWE8_9PSEU|nr:type I polyketide synthase [Kibdelosporangium banguiense]MBP2328241.1 acyl transferase domain-containing protein/acyl-CoA synthetase (AMP-forming)/AMP-acid ligase II/acyl carrier protein [Kibdelosporangium banguiense]
MPLDAVSLRFVAELLTANARQYGEKTAFTDDHRSVTWSDMEHRTAGLATGLDVGRGARVAFLVDNSVELIEGLLATVRAAAVGVPLSPHCTDAELAALLADCDPAVLVTDQRHLTQVVRVTARRSLRLVVTGEAAVPDGALRFEKLTTRSAAPRDDLGLDEPAWMLYTSGTTGTPRAVISSQRSALWSAFACYIPGLALCADDRVLWPLPLAHSYAHSLCLLGVTAAGASARVAATPDPVTLASLIDEYAPTLLAGVPVTYQQLLDTSLDAVPSLRLCVTAGAPSDPALREQVEQRWGAPLLDGYGSTETCGMIAMERIDGTRARGTSGPPVPGVDVRLVDPGTGRDATEGEIWVRGPNLLLGYHNRPESLVDGWYHTGDLGRLERGHLAVTGRVSDRIVRGGENVDPAEVEQVLRGLPGVRDAVVVARPHPLLGEVPVAFVVPARRTLDPAGLLRACAAVLSPHKVPDEVLFTPAVPRTAIGKPRRHMLRQALTERQPDREIGGPATLVEMVRDEITAIGGTAGDPDAAFADLGVTSMGAMTLWHRLSLRTGLTLPATLVWDHPSPTAVATYLASRLHGSAPASTAPRERPETEPVAIVAAGCRYPGGVRSPEDLWRLVAEGVDATSEFPDDRGWDMTRLYHPDPDRIGTTYTRRGGFLTDAADFDPVFFGISPREALAADPQQRLLLEVAWETLERAGIPATAVRGTNTGVFVGLMHTDYGNRVRSHELEAHLAIGSAGSVASGRIAYVLGLRGPTLTVDTACSSSLVAMDLAATALRTGKCTLALAGGAMVMSSPQPFIAFSRQRGLSPDGRCRSFAAGADGTAWAEGAGLVLLEKLTDARRNGHPVLAVLRGSAVNSDGTSNGLTAPSGPAQRELIQLALVGAGLRASDVDVIEGHGTGTALGDPIEAGALLATYGQDRDPADPAWLGSVKSNLGHTQAAAGIAGVIKMIEAMRHAELPRSLYADEPSPYVDWSAGAVRLLDRARPWPSRGRPRRAAISSFGIGGTNAHVIIEEAPETEAPHSEHRWADAPWLVSGSDEAGLRAHAARLADALEETKESTVDVAFSLATTRTPLTHRAAVLTGHVAGLRDLANGVVNPSLRTGIARNDPKVALLCAGQGAQRSGMGRALAAALPVFDTVFTEVCDEFTPWLPRPLRQVIDDGPLDRTDYAQPALFAFEVALHALLAEYGVRPDYLVGHSVGELAAAHIAGVFSRADAIRLVAARGRLMATLPTSGAMIAVRAPVDEVSRYLMNGIAIAAVNGPKSVVLSGGEAAVTELAARIGRPATRLRVSYAFHSPQVDPILAEFRAVAESVEYQRPSVPIVSTVTGRPETDVLTTADYWVRQARETVRFADAVGWLADAGVTAFVEAGPSVALSVLAEECLTPEAVCVPTGAAATDVLAALATLHVHGVPVDWQSVYAASGARRHPLPTYPFQRQRYWLNAVQQPDVTSHPLLGEPHPDADGPNVRHNAVLSAARQPWLADHVVGSRVVVPATVFAELAWRASGTSDAVRLAELALYKPLTLPGSGEVPVQVVVGAPDETGQRPVTVWAAAAGSWTRHATATIAPAVGPPAPSVAWPPAGAEEVPIDYTGLAARGHHYGPAFQAVTKLWRRDADLFAELTLAPGEAATGGSYLLHPVLLDAALHATLLAEPAYGLQVPVMCTGLTVYKAGATAARAHVVRLGPDEVRVSLTDPTGLPLAVVESMVTRPMQVGELYRLAWRTATPGTAGTEHELFDVTALAIEGDLPGRAHELVTAVLTRVRDWVAGSQPGRLVVLTHNATGDDPDPAEAAATALVRSAQAEHPDRIVLIDRRGGTSMTLDAALRTGEPQVALDGDTVLVPRLVASDPPTGAAPQLDPDGTVLITGGTGALGASLARHLVATYGIRNLLLVNRSGRTPAWAADLPAQVIACDVSDPAAVDALIASCSTTLTAVFHLAGVVDDGVVAAMTPQRVAAVLAAKVDGAWNLHEATKGLGLAAFVQYSSAAGMLGRPGQSNYAAANGFLDALARHRVARGLPAQALAWGPWSTADKGMAGQVTGLAQRHLTEGGVLAVTEQEGIALLDLALGTAEPVLAPIPLDFTAPGQAVPPVLTDLLPGRPAPTTNAAVAVEQSPGAWRDRLAAVPANERETVLTELIRVELATALGFPDAAALPVDREFTELGFDSLIALQVRNRLSAFIQVRLPPTLVLDYPTLPAMTAHVLSALRESLGESLPDIENVAEDRRHG